MQVTTIGLDLAKHWFQVHGVDTSGVGAVCRKLRRGEVLSFFQSLPPTWSAWKPVPQHITGHAMRRPWRMRGVEPLRLNR